MACLRQQRGDGAHHPRRPKGSRAWIPAPRATGQITARVADTTLLTQAQTNAPAEFASSYTIDANRSLTITLHEVYLALAKTPIEGPAGIEASFEFRAAFHAPVLRMMTVMLMNQRAGTEYA